MRDTELLQSIHETAQMGIEGLRDVAPLTQNPAMRGAIGSQVKEYEAIAAEAAGMLRALGETPKQPGLMAKMSSEVMTTLETLRDSSPSKLAEMIIQGNTMGVTKSLQHLHDYSGRDGRVCQLAQRLLETEQSNVEAMKPFL